MSGDSLKVGKDWFGQMGWKPFAFQLEGWQAYLEGYSGLVNAPTGSGKTYSVMMPVILEFLQNYGPQKTLKNQLTALKSLNTLTLLRSNVRAHDRERLVGAFH